MAGTAVLACAAVPLHAQTCIGGDRYVISLTVKNNAIVDPGDAALTGWGTPTRIVWRSPPGYMFQKGGIAFAADPNGQFSNGHQGDDTAVPPLPAMSRWHHWCNKNNDHQTHKYTILLFKVSDPTAPPLKLDPNIVNN